ncbi:MAG: hypothetical protein U9N54_05905 [candidate division Zixibacteria bacterium]|nr:hypothetical protein [candidate division Zixibacteria bacterium]
MKKNCLIILVFMFVSCSENNFIYYELNGVTVTRIDDGNKIYIYHGRCDNSFTPCSESYVKAEYSGFNSGMSGYIIFNTNGSVDFVKVDALVEKTGKDSLLNIFKFKTNYEAVHWRDSIKGNYGKIVEVSDILKLEKSRNLENKSKVKVTYPR